MTLAAIDPTVTFYPGPYEGRVVGIGLIKQIRTPEQFYSAWPVTSESALGRIATSNTVSGAISNKVGLGSVGLGSAWARQTSARALGRSVEPPTVEVAPAIDVPRQLAVLKRLTGLGWEGLADLLGCTRQALHRWTLGEAISDAKRDRLGKLHATMTFVDRGSIEDNQLLMTAAAAGCTVAELLAQGRFDEVRGALGPGPGRRDATWDRVISRAVLAEDHWFTRLINEPDTGAREVNAKPQATKRIQLRKG